MAARRSSRKWCAVLVLNLSCWGCTLLPAMHTLTVTVYSLTFLNFATCGPPHRRPIAGAVFSLHSSSRISAVFPSWRISSPRSFLPNRCRLIAQRQIGSLRTSWAIDTMDRTHSISIARAFYLRRGVNHSAGTQQEHGRLFCKRLPCAKQAHPQEEGMGNCGWLDGWSR